MAPRTAGEQAQGKAARFGGRRQRQRRFGKEHQATAADRLPPAGRRPAYVSQRCPDAALQAVPSQRKARARTVASRLPPPAMGDGDRRQQAAAKRCLPAAMQPHGVAASLCAQRAAILPSCCMRLHSGLYAALGRRPTTAAAAAAAAACSCPVPYPACGTCQRCAPQAHQHTPQRQPAAGARAARFSKALALGRASRAFPSPSSAEQTAACMLAHVGVQGLHGELLGLPPQGRSQGAELIATLAAQRLASIHGAHICGRGRAPGPASTMGWRRRRRRRARCVGRQESGVINDARRTAGDGALRLRGHSLCMREGVTGSACFSCTSSQERPQRTVSGELQRRLKGGPIIHAAGLALPSIAQAFAPLSF